MSTGDQDAVYAMYEMLLDVCAEPSAGVQLAWVRDQLRKEYGVQVNEGDESKASRASDPSKEEVVLVSKYIDEVLGRQVPSL